MIAIRGDADHAKWKLSILAFITNLWFYIFILRINSFNITIRSELIQIKNIFKKSSIIIYGNY